jgi:hypothetical protein
MVYSRHGFYASERNYECRGIEGTVQLDPQLTDKIVNGGVNYNVDPTRESIEPKNP